MACLFQDTWPFTVALEGMQDHGHMTEKRHELMSRARAGGQRFGEAFIGFETMYRSCRLHYIYVPNATHTCPATGMSHVLTLPSLWKLALFTLFCIDLFWAMAPWPNCFVSEDRGCSLSTFVSLDLSTETIRYFKCMGRLNAWLQ